MSRSLCLLLTSLLLCSQVVAEGSPIVLVGDSYMSSVADALDRLQLAYDRRTPETLPSRPPASVQAVFISYDSDTGTLIPWLTELRAAGGVIFTYYNLSPGLSELMGVDAGPYLRDETRFASIATAGVTTGAPTELKQHSANINMATPRDSSVRVVAHWLDRDGLDHGDPALLMGPAGVHMTHVLLGQDAAGAARLYASLLGHYHPQMWQEAVAGALRSSADVGGGPAQLMQRVQGLPKAGKSLARHRVQLQAAESAAAEGRGGEALDLAFAARRLATEAYAQSLNSRPGEMRAVWIHSPWGVADWGWDRTCRELAEAGFNAIIPNMLDAGITSYPSQTLPVDGRVTDRGDQMTALMTAARRHGLEVHAWKVNYNLNTAPAAFVEKMRRERRLQADQSGVEMPWLCPSHPANRHLEVESMIEVVRNYDVDGMHFDYIRYPGTEGCYCGGCEIRFQIQTGHIVEAWPRDVLTGELTEPFQKWRQQQITALVREVGVRSRQIKPEVQLSAAVFSQWEESRFSVGQDWVLWAQEGYLDFVCPMDYIPEPAQFEATLRRQVDWIDGRIPLYAGIGAWQMPSADQVLMEIEATRRLGADGFVLFEYSADLARRILPITRQGLTAQKASPPHHGPFTHLRVVGPPAQAGPGTVPLYSEGSSLAIEAQLVPRSAVPRARGNLLIEDLQGNRIDVLGDLSTPAVSTSFPFTAPGPGDFRVAVHGTYRDADGKRHDFTRRGPLLRVRTAAQLDSLAARSALPALGDGEPIGLFMGGWGAAAIGDILKQETDWAVFNVEQVTPEVLAHTRLLVIPQPHNRWAFDRSQRLAMRQWVADGGRLLVTHDMAGLRGALPIVPDVCARGLDFPRSTRWQLVTEHAATAGVPTGLQSHSYYDHVTLEPGPAGQVLAVDDTGQPVLVVGPYGRGRYAALGLIPGLGPDDEEVPIEGAEAQLVAALVHWLADDQPTP